LQPGPSLEIRAGDGWREIEIAATPMKGSPRRIFDAAFQNV
jgi:hypothetical protein